MALESTPPGITPAVITALGTDLQTIIDGLAAHNINLTMDDRKKATTIAEKRTGFGIDYFTNKNDYPTLKPPFMNETEANAHWALVGGLMNILTKTAKLHELVDDLKLNSEHFAFQYALEGYATVQRGKEQNVPGADTFYQILSKYFEGQGSTNGTKPEEPTTPTGPTPPAPPMP